ncbi:MAG: hypothetical protein WEB37_09845 [Bacteroidota bacterium]
MPEKVSMHSVNRLLQLAFLEGAIITHGLYEKIVLRRADADHVDNRLRTITMKKLLREIASAAEPLPPKTVGEFLSEMRIRRQVSLFAVRRRLDVPMLTYRMIENDTISPLKVPMNTWKRIKDMGKIPWEELEIMIRASHYLAVFRPSYRGTLLRYRRKTSSTYPPDPRLSAARELYLRARLPLPARERQSIDDLICELKDV